MTKAMTPEYSRFAGKLLYATRLLISRGVSEKQHDELTKLIFKNTTISGLHQGVKDLFSVVPPQIEQLFKDKVNG